MNNDNYKKWFIGLAGGFVVIAGVLTSSFYVSYEKVKGELAQTSGELLNAPVAQTATSPVSLGRRKQSQKGEEWTRHRKDLENSVL